MMFIAIPVFVGSLDLTVVSAFLPELLTELNIPFDTGLDNASWIVTGLFARLYNQLDVYGAVK